MSGGTWDYEDRRMRSLAGDIRDGRSRYSDTEELELPDARHTMASIMDELATLVAELDWHFAGDSHIDDEQAWIERALERLTGSFIPWPAKCTDCGIATQQDVDPSPTWCTRCAQAGRT